MASTVRRFDAPTEWFEERFDYISEFMLPERVENMVKVASARTRYMTICAENTYHSQNASALIRHCEAFGVQDLHAVESLCRFTPNTHVVRGTDKWIDLYKYRSTESALLRLKERGYRIVATTPHLEDTTPEDFDIAAGPFCLVFGTEHEGISEEVKAAADEFLRIPMCGFVESLNVSASAAIVIYQLSERLRRSNLDWRLSDNERAQLLYEWVMRSVKDAKGIMARKYGEER